MSRLLRKPEVLERTGVSAVTLWRMEKAGEFPRRRLITGRIVGWLDSDVDAWCENRPVVELDAGDDS